jgi:hypothetical protein
VKPLHRLKREPSRRVYPGASRPLNLFDDLLSRFYWLLLYGWLLFHSFFLFKL